MSSVDESARRRKGIDGIARCPRAQDPSGAPDGIKFNDGRREGDTGTRSTVPQWNNHFVVERKVERVSVDRKRRSRRFIARARRRTVGIVPPPPSSSRDGRVPHDPRDHRGIRARAFVENDSAIATSRFFVLERLMHFVYVRPLPRPLFAVLSRALSPLPLFLSLFRFPIVLPCLRGLRACLRFAERACRACVCVSPR